MNTPLSIIIIGTGFGGSYAFKELQKKTSRNSDVSITVVSNTDHFLFTPLLHEAATGGVALKSIITPIRSLPQMSVSTFVQGHVQSIDTDSKTILIKRLDQRDGDEDSLSYDILLFAPGSETSYFNIKGAKEYTIPLKSLADAKQIKNTIIDTFESATRMNDTSKLISYLRFVIIGGGPTGVELAGELSDFIQHEAKSIYPRESRLASIVIIDGHSSILSSLSSWFQERATNILISKRNISFVLNTLVKEVTPQGIVVDDAFIESSIKIWTAGVKGTHIPIISQKDIQKEERTGRIAVTPFLNLASYPDVFIIGDKALIYDESTAKPYPQRAQFAVLQAQCAVSNIMSLLYKRELKPFNAKESGTIISLGSGNAIAEIYGIRLSGVFAWFLYRTVYLLKLFGIRAKIRTGSEWFINLFTSRDMSRED